MKTIKVATKKGVQEEEIYTISECPMLYYLFTCKESKKRDVSYIEVPAAFDIETTNVFRRTAAGNIDPDFHPYSFMYHWQFCIGTHVVFGRTWEEFKTLIDDLQRRMNLNNKHRLVIWCHNLRFEAQFMLPFLKLSGGFWREDREPLKLEIDGGIEFRDSFALSNMSLYKWGLAEGIEHIKDEGANFDYDKIRYPDTYLTPDEASYCYNDVRGLCECVENYMKVDTLASMPMTSTGFVRRAVRNEMRKNKNNRVWFKDSSLDVKTYPLLKEAFRGGDTHGNAVYADQTMTDVYSIDISSSYPSQLCMQLFPVGKFRRISAKRFKTGGTRKNYFHVLTLVLKNAKYVGKCGDPYIPYSKTFNRQHTKEPVIDNGRVLRWYGYFSIVVTCIDYDIIMNEYRADEVYIAEVYMSGKGYLPKEFTDFVKLKFKEKTELKGVDEYYYNKAKNVINSLYGMAVTSIDSDLVVYDQETKTYTHIREPLENVLKKHYKNRNHFLPYQIGVFCTAHARKQLREMMNLIGRDVVYCDTDSVKFIGAENLKRVEAVNAELKNRAIEFNCFADDKNGKRHYMGVWEYEGKYKEFRHIGAKRYIYSIEGKEGYNTTIAGVNKQRGREHFSKVGINRFTDGEIIQNAGHLVAYYNDDDIYTLELDGRTFTTASNVALVDDTYTLGFTDNYIHIMEEAKKGAAAFS